MEGSSAYAVNYFGTFGDQAIVDTVLHEGELYTADHIFKLFEAQEGRLVIAAKPLQYQDSCPWIDVAELTPQKEANHA